ncbi:MAG: hypothetical protein A4E30_00799 [Methanomassiliicoccales archaeon PtaB.Bin215]|nr:MAG: hypothetical protein A4E30_00799 [Methanomassiliicoccales archaeon PtaB.Bin215]
MDTTIITVVPIRLALSEQSPSLSWRRLDGMSRQLLTCVHRSWPAAEPMEWNSALSVDMAAASRVSMKSTTMTSGMAVLI